MMLEDFKKMFTYYTSGWDKYIATETYHSDAYKYALDDYELQIVLTFLPASGLPVLSVLAIDPDTYRTLDTNFEKFVIVPYENFNCLIDFNDWYKVNHDILRKEFLSYYKKSKLEKDFE